MRKIHSKMNKTIEIAKCTLADYFNINIKEFESGRCRKKNIIEAKRFLIYFMISELGIKFFYVKDYVPSYTSHCIAMYHYYKMIDMMEYEPDTKEKYENFKTLLLSKGTDKLEGELIRQRHLRKSISSNIKQLKKMINEA